MARAAMVSDAYYQLRRRTVQVGETSLAVLRRPALGRGGDTGPAAKLLASHAEVAGAADVLVMHCGDGLAGVGLAARAPQARIVMTDASAAAVASARATAAENDARNVEVIPSDCARAVLDRRFDAVLALQPKGRAVWEQTVLDAAAILRPGGAFYLGGARNCGIRTAGRFAAEVFGPGRVEVVAYKAGSRLFRAIRPAEMDLAPSDYYEGRRLSAEAGGEQLTYCTRGGLFSRDALDEGTRMLIEALAAQPLAPRDCVLDLGCGCGVLTLVAARQAARGQAVGVDVDCRAVEAARRTIEINALDNAEALVSDCIEAVADRRFDAVVTNPPLHQGRSPGVRVAEQFIRDAARVLTPSGRLVLVENRFLKYAKVMAEAFQRVEVVRENAKFRVWWARGPKRPGPSRAGGRKPAPRRSRRRRAP